MPSIIAQVAGSPIPVPTPPPPGPPSSSPPPWPGRLLELQTPYMVGSDVLTWQTQMHTRGWTITTDSTYGPQSRGVCLAFQEEKHLTADGIVGPVTWAASWTAPVT